MDTYEVEMVIEGEITAVVSVNASTRIEACALARARISPRLAPGVRFELTGIRALR